MSISNINDLKATFDLIPFIITIKRKNDLKYVFFNKTAIEIFGIKLESALEKTAHELYDNETAKIIKAHDSTLSPREEETITVPGRGAHWFTSYRTSYTDPTDNTKYIITFLHDTTNQKQTEMAMRIQINLLESVEKNLAESEIYVRSILESTYAGIILVDQDSALIEDINSYVAKLLGANKEDIIGKNYSQFDPALFTINTNNYIKNIYGKEIPVIKHVASFVFNDMTHQLITITDITERKQFEKRLANIIDFLPDATLVIDQDSKVTAWNKSMEALSGIKAEDIIGKGDYEYALPFYQNREPLLIDAVMHPSEIIEKKYTNLKQKEALFSYEKKVTMADGRRLFLFAIAAPLKDPEGNIIGAIESIRDVTNKKTMEEEREKMQAMLLHSEKLASIGTLAAGIAHEINNPLFILSMTIKVIEDSIENINFKDNAVKNNFEKISHAMKRIQDIVNGLRTYARSDTTIVENVNINEAINETLYLCESIFKAEHNITIEKHFLSTNTNILANTGKLQQVFMNLLTNARDAILDSGNNKLSGGFIDIETTNKNGNIIIRFSDNGCGMCSENLDRIFDPFYTTKEIGKGTGIGLSIVQSIISSFRGTVQVESEQGMGTTFTITFPPLIEQENKIEIDKKISIPPIIGNVLLVDDEAEIRELLSMQLTEMGLTVTEASDGEEALNLLKTRNFKYVITDIKMPKMTGDRLIKEATQIGIQTIFIVISCGAISDYSQDQRICIRTLAKGYLKKPFTRESLYLLLKSLE